MKWYFASRTRHQKKIKIFAQFLEQKGEVVASDWIYEGILIPYHEHLPEAQRVASAITNALLTSDIFVLVSDPEGTDMFVELGVALAKNAAAPGSIRTYIIGEHARRSLMQLHPSITHLGKLKEVFDKEGVISADFSFPDLH